MGFIAGVGIVAALLLLVALVGGLFVLGITHVFHLQDLVHLTYWQCCGISLLCGGSSVFSSSTD